MTTIPGKFDKLTFKELTNMLNYAVKMQAWLTVEAIMAELKTRISTEQYGV